MKINYIHILLILVIVVGFYIRLNHIDFPSTGLHNMKQNEYLSEAQLMISNSNQCLLHRCTYLFWGLEPGNFGDKGSGYFEEYTQLPIIPWMTIIGWKIMNSEPIWFPRLIMILFSLGSIIMMYLLVKKLVDNEYLAVLSAFLFTVMPVGIYFGSQGIQPDMPATFFTIVAVYYFISWSKSFNKKDIFLSTMAVSVAGLFKETFLIILVPLVFLVPWKKFWYMKFKESLPQVGYCILGLLPFVIFQGLYSLLVVTKDKIQSESILLSFSRLIDLQYWGSTIPSLQSGIADNFTWWFFIITILGIVLAVWKRETLIGKVIIGYVVSLIPFCGLLSGKLAGQSYYFLVYLPLVCIASAFFLFNCGMLLKDVIPKVKYIEYVPLLLIIFIYFSMFIGNNSIQTSNERMFGTVFFGQELAGQYIKEHTNSDERIFIYGQSQTFATCRYAQRRCGQPYKNNISIQSMEGNANYTIEENPLNVSYLTFDQYGLYILQTLYISDWEYIQNNYHIVWLGTIPQNGQLVPYIYILKQGGKLNMSNLQEIQPYLATTYHMSYGDIPFYVVETE